MPLIREIHIPFVTHIGHLDQSREDLAPSRDGPALAVSTCPDIWQAMLGSNAPHVELFNPTALWVDGFAFTPDCMDEIASWAVRSRYMDPARVYTASWVDPQTGKLKDDLFITEDDARKASGPDGMIFDMEGYHLSSRAQKRLGRWHNPVDWYGAAVILYTREVIIPKRPLVVGVWWHEAHDPDTRSAPGGQLLPEGIDKFEVEDDDGDMISFSSAYPEYTKMGAKPVLLFSGT